MTNSDRYSPDGYSADLNADQIDDDVIEHQDTDKTKRVAGKHTAKTAPPKEITPKKTTMKALAQQELAANSAARRNALATISSQSKPLQFKPLQSKPLQKGAQTAGTGIVWTLLGIGLAACGGGGGGGASNAKKPVISDAGSAALAGPVDGTDGSTAKKQDLSADTFIIDTTASAKGAADVITNFGFANDKITFVAEGGADPVYDFYGIWLLKDGDDILITTSEAKNAKNVLAVLKDVFKGVDDDFEFTKSLVDFDLSFITKRHVDARWFEVYLDPALSVAVTDVTVIADGSADGRDVLDATRGDDENGIDTAYIKIDVEASDKDGADRIGRTDSLFNNGTDKIILAGDVKSIIVEVKTGTVGGREVHTTYLYKNEKGDDKILAIIDEFRANSDNFDITDFLVQEGQSFTVEVIPTAQTAGATAGKQTMTGTDNIDEAFSIDSTASAKGADDAAENTLEAADVIENFNATNDKILLTGDDPSTTDDDVKKIVAQVSGTNTILYKTEKGVNNVLAVLSDFQATADNFDITDFLVQAGQSFTVEVLAPDVV